MEVVEEVGKPERVAGKMVVAEVVGTPSAGKMAEPEVGEVVDKTAVGEVEEVVGKMAEGQERR